MASSLSLWISDTIACLSSRSKPKSGDKVTVHYTVSDISFCLRVWMGRIFGRLILIVQSGIHMAMHKSLCSVSDL